MLESYVIGHSLNRQQLPELLDTLMYLPSYLLKDVAREIAQLDGQSQVDILAAGAPYTPIAGALLPEVLGQYSSSQTPFNHAQSTTLLRMTLDYRVRGLIDGEQANACLHSLVGGYVPETDQTFLPVLSTMSESNCRWFEITPELDQLFARHIQYLEPKGFFEQEASKAMVRSFLPNTLDALSRHMPGAQLTNLLRDVIEHAGDGPRVDVIAHAIGDEKLIKLHDGLYGSPGVEPLTVDLLKRLPFERVLTPARVEAIRESLASYGMPAVLTAVLADKDAVKVPKVSRFIGNNMEGIVNNIDGVFAHRNLVDVATREGKLPALSDSVVAMGRRMLLPSDSFDPKTAPASKVLAHLSSTGWGEPEGREHAAHYYQGTLTHLQKVVKLAVETQKLNAANLPTPAKPRRAPEPEFSL